MFYHLKSGTALFGFLLALPLMLMWRTRPANVWLGLFLLAISTTSMAEWYANQPTMFGVFDWPNAAFGPLYYMYVRSVIGRRLRWADAWHAAPVAWYFGVLMVIRLDMLGTLRIGPETMVPILDASFLAVQILCFGYLLAVFLLLHQHRRHVRDYFSSTARRDLDWLTWLSVVLLVAYLIWMMVSYVERRAGDLLAVCRLAILYFVAWFGSRQVAVFQTGHPADAPLPAPVSAALPAEPAAVPAAPSEKYARSGMTDAARDLIGQRLRQRMEAQHDYLDNDLTLGFLAERIGTSPNLVSEYLNAVLKTSFFDYVNGFRIAAVERKMLDPAEADTTLLDMALACGFNSKSTFYAAFKRVHGMSPSAWRKAGPRSAVPAPS